MQCLSGWHMETILEIFHRTLYHIVAQTFGTLFILMGIYVFYTGDPDVVNKRRKGKKNKRQYTFYN